MHSGRWVVGFALSCWSLAGSVLAADVVHRSRWLEVDLTEGVPRDFAQPEGRTRWDLRGIALGPRWERTIASESASWTERREEPGAAGAVRFHVGRGRLDDAEHWLLPQRDPVFWKAGVGRALDVETEGPAGRRSLWVRTERAGVGWLFLPSGPREVVLQRALVLSRGDGESELRPDSLVHRWIDPRAGVVAEIRGPVSPDGTTRLAIDGAAIVEEVIEGTTDPKIYVDEVDLPIRTRVRFGWDRRRAGENPVPVSSLTPAAPATIGALLAAGAWDFSQNNPTNYPGMNEFDSFTVEMADAQSIAAQTNECGFTDNPARKIGREDRLFADGGFDVTLSVTERRDGVTSAGRIDLVAAHRNEGEGGVGLEAEARVCHDPAMGRTAIPLWSFANSDAGGWFAAPGDQWQSDPPFNCQQIIWTNAVISQQLWVKAAASSSLGPLSGRQHGRVVAAGPVTLPSGHTFNAVVLRSWVEYNTFGGGSCLFAFEPVRTVTHLFEVPSLGTVARLQSANNVALPIDDTLTSFPETDFKFGLFPPREINVLGTTTTSVELSWDPGLYPGEISRYKIYWDTDSGAASAYGFNSDTHPGQVGFAGTTAVVSGLTPGVPYYFTVTSVRDYCEPGLCANNACAPACPGAPPSPCPPIVCNVVTPVESAVFPTQLGGPTPVPAEVGATPGGACVPTAEVTGVTMSKTAGAYQMCWTPSADPCVQGYQILGAASPTSDANFSVLVDDTGLTNCWTFDPAATYLLVVGRSAAGTGPWGHFGH